MDKRIKLSFDNSFFILLLIYPFFQPLAFKYINVMSGIYEFFKYIKIVFFIFILFYILYKICNRRLEKNKWLFLITIFYFTLFISCLVNKVSVINPIIDFINVFSISYITIYYVKEKNSIKYLKVFTYYLLFVSIINIIVVLIYKEGIPNLDYGTPSNPLYFLALDNGHSLINIALIAGLLFLYSKIKSKRYLFLLIIPMISAIVIDSATLKLVTFLFILLWCLKPFFKYKWFAGFTFIFLFLLIVITIFSDTDNNLFFQIVSFITNRDTSFTGRTFLWEKSFELIKTSPIFGLGDTSIDHLEVWGGTFSSHNFFIEIMLDGGLIALMSFSGLIIYITVVTIKNINVTECLITSFSIFLMLICYMSEVSGHSPYAFIVLSFGFAYVDQKRISTKIT